MNKIEINLLRQAVWGNCRLSDLRKAFPPHFHSFYTFGILIRGLRNITIEKEKRLTGPESIVIVNPYENHSCVSASPEKGDWLTITVSRKLMQLIYKTAPQENPPVFENWQKDSAAIKMLRGFSAAIEKYDDEDKIKYFKNFLSFLEMKPAASRKTDEWISAMESFRKEHPGQRPALHELGFRSGMDKFGFLRAFRKNTGITPYRYYEIMRLEEACSLLARGEKPALSAIMAGYYDQSHLCRHCGRYLGLTPSAYQKAWVKHHPASTGSNKADFYHESE